MEYVSERLELRTAEAEAIETEELQNTLNQPNDGGGAGGVGGDALGGRGVDGGDGQAAEDGSDTGGKGVVSCAVLHLASCFTVGRLRNTLVTCVQQSKARYGRTRPTMIRAVRINEGVFSPVSSVYPFSEK